MTLKEDGRYILVIQVSEIPKSLPGSIIVKCCECGEDVWLCKALQNFESDGCVCSHCYLDQRKDKVNEVVITEGVRKQVYDWTKDRKTIMQRKFN